MPAAPLRSAPPRKSTIIRIRRLSPASWGQQTSCCSRSPGSARGSRSPGARMPMAPTSSRHASAPARSAGAPARSLWPLIFAPRTPGCVLRITQPSYLGGFYRYAIRVGSDQYLVDDEAALPVGRTVGIALPATALHLYEQ